MLSEDSKKNSCVRYIVLFRPDAIRTVSRHHQCSFAFARMQVASQNVRCLVLIALV